MQGRQRSFQLWIAASGSDKLLIDATGRMGGSWLTVAARDGALLAVSHREREYMLEKSSPGFLERLSGWPLEPRECAGVLLGDLPARLVLQIVPFSALEAQGGVELVLRGAERSGAARRYVFRRGSGSGDDGARLLIEGAGELLAEITYLSWLLDQGIPVPAHLRLRNERGTLELRLVTLDAGAPSRAFELRPPEGFQRRRAPTGQERPLSWGDPEAGS